MEGRWFGVIYFKSALVSILFLLVHVACGQRGEGIRSNAPQQKKQNTSPDTSVNPVGQTHSGRFLVKFKSSFNGKNRNLPFSGLDRAQALLSQAGGDLDSSIQVVHETLFVLKLSDKVDPTKIQQNLRASSEIDFIRPDPVVYAIEDFDQNEVSDPLFSKQYAHKLLQSEKAWEVTRGSKDVIIAYLDSGTDPEHPDLKENLWKNTKEIPDNQIDDDQNGYIDDVMGWNFLNDTHSILADDIANHGTHVGGTIAAVFGNGIGGAGHAPGVRLLPLKFLNKKGSGYLSDAIRAIDYAIDQNVKVISNSWGGAQGDPELEAAIKRAHEKGILFVAAAGNGGEDGIGDNNDETPIYPADYDVPNMIVVSATDQKDYLARFSNYGFKKVHVAAPGNQICSTLNSKNGKPKYGERSGTSMATPAVSAVLGLMFSIRPDLSVEEIKHILLENVDVIKSLKGKVKSGGRVNAFKAVQATLGLKSDESDSSPENPQDDSQNNPGNHNPEDPANTPGIPIPQPEGPIPGTPNDPDLPPDLQPELPNDPQNIAPVPLLNGEKELTIRSPKTAITIHYDVGEIASDTPITGVYIEIVGPNQEFSSPNSMTPDPARITFGNGYGVRGQVVLVPYYSLPTWGVYQIRLIPIGWLGQPIGRFSNAATLSILR